MECLKTSTDSIAKLTEALAKCQCKLECAKKDGNNLFFKSKYADLASVWEACREPLAANNLAVIQTTTFMGSDLILVTTLSHISGEWIKSFHPINPVRNDPQGLGSALTYARRYSLAAIVGVSPDDDDGEGAMNRGSKNSPTPIPKGKLVTPENVGFKTLAAALIQIDQITHLKNWWAKHAAEIGKLPDNQRKEIEASKDELKSFLMGAKNETNER